MEIFFRQSGNENEAAFIERMTNAQTWGGPAKTFCGAIVAARRSVIFEGLRPYRIDDGELTYSAAQGAKAACLAMEDVAATLQIQMPILERLNGISILLKICLTVLAYIAYKVS